MKRDALNQFFGAYFHQDWSDEVGSQDPDAVILFFSRNESAEQVRALVSELNGLIDAGLSDAELERLVQTEFGGYIIPTVDGWTWTAWIQHIVDLLE